MSYLQKRLEQHQDQKTEIEFSKFKGKPYWIKDPIAHAREYDKEPVGSCCTWHLIGPPTKLGTARPLYPYQQKVIDALEAGNRLVAICKCRSAGITEIILRWLSYKTLSNPNEWKNKNGVILSGTSEQLSISFIRRIRAHHPNVDFSTRENVVYLGNNNFRLQSLPSRHIATLRGLSDLAVAVVEEFDWWGDSISESEILPTLLPHIQKSNPYIILITTPGKLNSLMHKIVQEPESTTIWKRILIPYNEPLQAGFFSSEEIALARQQTGFEREFNLTFGAFGSGNLFPIATLQQCIEQGTAAGSDYSVIKPTGEITIGCDAGWGSSKFGVIVLQMLRDPDNKKRIHVAVAKEFDHPYEDDMVNYMLKLHKASNQGTIYADQAGVSFIRNLKNKLGDPEWEWHREQLRKRGIDDLDFPTYMKVVPVNFATHGQRLLQLLTVYMGRGLFSIHPDHENLISQLASAKLRPNATSDWQLDKNSSTSGTMDLVDSMRCAVFDYR